MATSLGIDMPRVGRKLRAPQHHWSLRHVPFALQPFCIAPVLPGETMKNALLQARAVTMPIKSPLVGWWLEHYLFYVKHRHLSIGDTLVNMMLDPSVVAPNGATDVLLYQHNSRPGYVSECLKVVTETWFRDKGAAWNSNLIDTLPAARIQQERWDQSANTIALNNAGDFNVDQDASGTIMASEVSIAYERWQFLRANNLTDATYEDYLRSYGVRVEAEKDEFPELIRYSREWQYPANTVDPLTGVPVSAVSWAISERADKDRFFREPGFVFGITVARPKVYLSGQISNAAGLLKDAYSWLPAILRDDPMTSVATVTPAGIVPNATANQQVDLRDLFLYGDQFVNYDMATHLDGSPIALPTALNWRYPTKAMVSGLFAGSDPVVRQDGVIRLNIMGAQVDHTPRGSLVGRVA